jgi:hypothetical protein
MAVDAEETVTRHDDLLLIIDGFRASLSPDTHPRDPPAPTIAADKYRNDRAQRALPIRERTQSDERAHMHTLPVDRALSIYSALADRSETKGVREQLSRHLMKLYIEGEKDQHRLTVHGLSYLRDLDRAIDSRN